MCTAIVPLAQTVHFYTVSLVILRRPHASKPQSLRCDGSVAEPTKSNYKSCYKRWELPNLCLIHRSKSQGTRFISSFPYSLREVAYGVLYFLWTQPFLHNGYRLLYIQLDAYELFIHICINYSATWLVLPFLGFNIHRRTWGEESFQVPLRYGHTDLLK